MSEEVQKTPEELKAEKVAKFNANPETFVCLDDVILGAIRTPSGIMVCVGKTNRSSLEIALTRVQLRAFQTFIGMDIEASEAMASKIVTPGGNGHKKGIIDFVRTKRG